MCLTKERMRLFFVVTCTLVAAMGLSCIGCKPVDDKPAHSDKAEVKPKYISHRRCNICARPDPQIINELLSDDPSVRGRANSKVKEAIRLDKTEEMEEVGANISWKMGELFPEIKQESVRQHSGSIRDFVIWSAAQAGWWPQDQDKNVVRCTIYEREHFGPTTFECVVDVVCHDERTISFDFVAHEYRGDFEWNHCSSLYSILTGRKKQSTRMHGRDRF